MSTTNTLTEPTQVVAPVTYAEIVKSAQALKLDGICDVELYDKLPPSVQALTYADLVKRINTRKQEALGETLNAIDTLIQQTASDVLTQARELMLANGITTVNIVLTADTFGIVKKLNQPASIRSAGTGTKSSKYTYYINDNMVTGGSSAVAEALGIDTTTDQYKKANAWLKIAVQAKAQNSTITRINAETDTTEVFAPEATTKEAHAVWFLKQ